MKNGAVIIPAAGSGSRMQLDHPKQYHTVAGAPILIHTIRAFTAHPNIDTIIVVVPAQHEAESRALFEFYKLFQVKVCVGGARRQDSVKNGLSLLPANCEVVLVHDGARPMVDSDIISRCYHGAQEHGAVIAALPASDTLKRVQEKRIAATLNRETIWQAQTPQAVQKDLLFRAYELAAAADFTDEASLLEAASIPVTVVEGSQRNIKITRFQDLELAEYFLQEKENSMRIGHGFDAHKFCTGRPLILGGCRVSHPQGLAGHSDADVLTHALCDAILGALGKGDIGKHFPDSSDEFAGICSLRLLERVISLLDEAHYQLSNADITVVCQAPKLAPYLDEMKQHLADSCQTDITRINIKATTTEKMGYTGREEGISTHAVVLLERKG